MNTYTYTSTGYHDDSTEAKESALVEAKSQLSSFTIVKTEFKHYMCESCGYMHVYCILTVQGIDKPESDLAIKLKIALQLTNPL